MTSPVWLLEQPAFVQPFQALGRAGIAWLAQRTRIIASWEDRARTTASVQYSKQGFGGAFTNLTALWGMNKTAGHAGEHGALLEASHQAKTAVYGRYELVQKSVEEAVFGHHTIFPTYTFTGGAGYDLFAM